MASVERPKRPASVTFLAVFQLIIGVIGLGYELFKGGGSLMFLLSPSMLKTAIAANPAAAIPLQAPYFLETQLAASSFGLVLSIVLIADGIGLILLHRWAYNLGVLYGWLSIAYQVAWLAYYLVIAQPVITAGLENMPVPPQITSSGMQPQAYRDLMKSANILDIVLTALGLTYPIFVLIMLAVLRKAFRRPKWAPEGAVEVADQPAETGVKEGPPTGVTDLPTGYEPDDRIGPAPS